MIAEKYFPKGSPRYKAFIDPFKKLDGFFSLNPERWFSLWTIILAGANTAGHLENRWLYWEWSTFSYLFIPILVFSTWLDRYLDKFSFFSKNVDSIQSAISILLRGSVFFILGMIPVGFNYLFFIYGIPYLIFFLVGYMVWSIQIDTEEKSVPSKASMAPILLTITLLTVFVSIVGYLNDDPMISTIAAVYTPFPLVALIFPPAIRHIQRCRMHVVFIPAMFLSVRFPWLLIMVTLLFWILRYYNYFRFGEVKPSFKVDLPFAKDN